MLISDHLLVRKKYFDSNIVRNENVRILRRFSKDYFEADVDRSTFYMRRHQGAKCKHLDVSDVIYPPLAIKKEENVNVMLEFEITERFRTSTNFEKLQ